MTVGVTIGKFNPFHLGHDHLIRVAKSQVDRLVVIVAERSDQTIPGHRRADWISSTHPDVEVLVTPDDLPELPAPWAERTLDLLATPPAIAFTSEAYGDEWAGLMGGAHVPVDPDRQAFPISGTELRQNLRSGFRHLTPAAKADLAKKVVVVGAESSGTTTLTKSLAERYATVWAPEYGRWYWEGRRHLPDSQPWTSNEFEIIATEQIRLIQYLSRQSTGFTFCDTDALATAVWHQRYLGHRSEIVEALADANRPDLYILTIPSFPFVQDGTRLDGAHRQEMHGWFVEALERAGTPWIAVEGEHEDRVSEAITAIESIPWARLT